MFIQKRRVVYQDLSNLDIEISVDSNYTGRGNNDEVMLCVKILSPSEINLSGVKIDVLGTDKSDVEKIKVYHTSAKDFDSRQVSS